MQSKDNGKTFCPRILGTPLLLLDRHWIVIAGRVLVLIQVPALTRRQTSTRPASYFSKTARATAIANAKRKPQTNQTWRARRNGWAPLNRLAPHPLFPSCYLHVFSVLADRSLIGFAELSDGLRRYLPYIATLIKAWEIVKQKQFFILKTICGDNIRF